MSRAVLFGIVMLFGAGSAGASPNTRALDRILKDPASGRSFLLFVECSDGIIAPACKLLLHDERGARLAKTKMARITSWVCWSSSDCVAFSFDSWLPVLPDEVWRIHGGSVWLASNWWRPIGPIVHLWEARYPYLSMLGLFFLPFWAARRELRSGPGVLHVLGVALAVTGGGVFLLLWLCLAVVLMPISLPLLVVLIAVYVAVGSQLNNRRDAKVTVGRHQKPTVGLPRPWVYALVGLASFGATLLSRLVWSTNLIEQSWRELGNASAAAVAIALFGATVVLGIHAQKRRLTGRALLAGVPALLAFGPVMNALIAVVSLSCTPFVARRMRYVVASILIPLGAGVIDAAFVLFRVRLVGH